MILLVHDYEQSAKKYLESEGSLISAEVLKKNKEQLLSANKNLLSCLDGKTRNFCLHYFEQVNLALLSKDRLMLSEYTHQYKYFLYKNIISVDLKSFLDAKESVGKFSYLLSVEIPFSSILVAQNYKLDKRDTVLMRLGKIEGSVEKTNLLLQSLKSYSNHFESLNLKYKASVSSYIKYSLEGDYKRCAQMQDAVLSLQLSLFNSMQSFLQEHSYQLLF